MKTDFKIVSGIRRLVVMTLGSISLTAAMAASASANSDHWDRFSCYAYVHDQCYGNGADNCDREGYDWALDQCDGYYPSSAGVKRPKGARTFTATTNLKTKTKIQRSFRK
ncbi:hypothetical protein [Oricola thermophila]|uniref:DUF3551 domain-containing protein n=1 Tax=Oricola thermophila TaxID=2742145 RepID=A0A6N1VFP2_9HYPH|nr:hypothetical protein [Oricola thermophila]QKV18032.1 hypothetical protein HTY61_05920 [Oricola thermophila]